MTRTTIAIFQISTEEDLRFQLDFLGLDLTGRTLKVNVRRRDTNALVQALTSPSNMTLVGAGNLTVFYPRTSMSAWAKTEYEADVVDETGGSATRIMAVRFVYDEPGKLVYGVRGNQATVTFADNQATVTAIGGVGPPGPANVISIGDVETLETGEEATATLSGEAPTQVLNLGLPKGNTGTAATIAVGDVTTVAPGENAAVTNTGTSGAAVFDFEIPAGAAGTIAIGDVDTGAPGTPAEVENVGSSSEAILNFTIPAGLAATIAVGDVTTSLPGSDAEVTNVGTAGAAVLDFVIPRGDQGPPGSVADGDKGDIIVSGGGTVWEIDANVVGDSKLRDSAGLSVIGRSADSSGDPADIAAGTDGHVLRRSGTTLVFGTVATAGLADDAVTNAKLANIAANTIKGRITALTGDAEDLIPAQVRTITGQKWVAVYDSGPNGIPSPATAIDVDLTGYSEFRIILTVIPNTAVADFIYSWRSSINGGISYDSGASDYNYQILSQSGATVAGVGSATSSGLVSGGPLDSASGFVYSKTLLSFTKGTAVLWPRMDSRTSYFTASSVYAQDGLLTQRVAAGPVTHLRFLTSVADGFGIGTRLIVEGC